MPNNSSPIKAVWSDFGGVLTPPIEQTFVEFCTRLGLDMGPLLEGMIAVADDLGVPMMAPLDLALLTEVEWGRRISDHVERTHGIRHDLGRFSDEWFKDRPTNGVMVDYLRELRGRGYRIGMLTNNVREWEPHWRGMLPVEEIFDAVVNSCDVGVRKPDPAIFELAEHRFGLAPHECLLIDDLEENTAGARARGWQAVTYVDDDRTRSELEALLGNRIAAVGVL
ncbi:MAG TPA: HAD family phosphatase [Actinomycetales bacterium]|nr:HAD family phosphatase [Actinomycetales bacterium]